MDWLDCFIVCIAIVLLCVSFYITFQSKRTVEGFASIKDLPNIADIRSSFENNIYLNKTIESLMKNLDIHLYAPTDEEAAVALAKQQMDKPTLIKYNIMWRNKYKRFLNGVSQLLIVIGDMDSDRSDGKKGTCASAKYWDDKTTYLIKNFGLPTGKEKLSLEPLFDNAFIDIMYPDGNIPDEMLKRKKKPKDTYMDKKTLKTVNATSQSDFMAAIMHTMGKNLKDTNASKDALDMATTIQVKMFGKIVKDCNLLTQIIKDEEAKIVAAKKAAAAKAAAKADKEARNALAAAKLLEAKLVKARVEAGAKAKLDKTIENNAKNAPPGSNSVTLGAVASTGNFSKEAVLAAAKAPIRASPSQIAVAAKAKQIQALQDQNKKNLLSMIR